MQTSYEAVAASMIQLRVGLAPFLVAAISGIPYLSRQLLRMHFAMDELLPRLAVRSKMYAASNVCARGAVSVHGDAGLVVLFFRLREHEVHFVRVIMDPFMCGQSRPSQFEG